MNLATSDGLNFQGRRLSRYRRWQARKRAELQAKRTKSATRLHRKRARSAWVLVNMPQLESF